MPKRKKITEDDVKNVLSNPFYCGVFRNFPATNDYEPMISEEEWIRCAVRAIGEIGAEEFLTRMLGEIKKLKD